jgi:hypothetical protein
MRALEACFLQSPQINKLILEGHIEDCDMPTIIRGLTRRFASSDFTKLSMLLLKGEITLHGVTLLHKGFKDIASSRGVKYFSGLCIEVIPSNEEYILDAGYFEDVKASLADYYDIKLKLAPF